MAPRAGLATATWCPAEKPERTDRIDRLSGRQTSERLRCGRLLRQPGGHAGFIAVGNGTRWNRATRVALPSNAGAAGTGALSGVSCTGLGTCIAVGGYESATGADAGLLVTQSRGHWRRAV